MRGLCPFALPELITSYPTGLPHTLCPIPHVFSASVTIASCLFVSILIFGQSLIAMTF